MSETRPLAADQLLAHLLDAGVDFIVIGAFAVAAHGAPRATTDLDITPEPSADNLQRLMRALDAIDARMLPLDIPEHGEILSRVARRGRELFSSRPPASPPLTARGWAEAQREARCDSAAA